jgi:hypothetical protein
MADVKIKAYEVLEDGSMRFTEMTESRPPSVSGALVVDGQQTLVKGVTILDDPATGEKVHFVRYSRPDEE